ncbi:head-tail adaptor protein [Limibacter armeniacum]|uniref:phage head completion protein n=1 Tax=Limibacter armeniacum TaxID=466084 RepID=UPI002FE57D62
MIILNEYLEYLNAVEIVDKYKTRKVTYESKGIRPCKSFFKGGREMVSARKLQNNAAVEFSVRFEPSTFKLNGRVMFEGITYEIINIRRIGRNKYLQLDCKII